MGQLPEEAKIHFFREEQPTGLLSRAKPGMMGAFIVLEGLHDANNPWAAACFVTESTEIIKAKDGHETVIPCNGGPAVQRSEAHTIVSYPVKLSWEHPSLTKKTRLGLSKPGDIVFLLSEIRENRENCVPYIVLAANGGTTDIPLYSIDGKESRLLDPDFMVVTVTLNAEVGNPSDLVRNVRKKK